MDENKLNLNTDEVLSAEELTARRNEKVQNFKVDFSLDDIPDVDTSVVQENSAPVPEEPSANEAQEEEVQHQHTVTKKKKKSAAGCLKRILYGLFILVVSGVLAAFMIFFLLDSLAINRDQKVVDFEIPSGENWGTERIASELEAKGLIDNAFCFRVYSKLTKADGKWQVGAFTLSPDMGYSVLVETLQTMTPRETVTVTIPEGYTVEEIAKLMEENGVCDTESFYNAVIYGQYDYDFIRDIPTTADGAQYAGRIYRLEGYLFPDTYEFYMGSSGETVIGRLLENFDIKLTSEIRSQIADRGWTIDEAIIIASLIEGEAASKEDMEKVSKVLQNRMEPDSGYPKLELCSTRDYVKAILPSVGGIEVTSIAYNTYEREGLPVGAINNPGLQALTAALNPSTAEDMEKCYFFATDYNTGITYFSQTFAQHEKICRKYKIGMYG
ncbi:MAG: endolytic transglycosylase MltG [Clostridia bacterium]|nr:endolytic transglycosylase MltG [Clostridia bacterium]